MKQMIQRLFIRILTITVLSLTGYALVSPASVLANVNTPIIQVGSTTPAASALNESLSLLGYLPLSFQPAHAVSRLTAINQLATKQTPLPGRYAWHHSSSAKELAQLWQPLADNVMTEGAVMRFEWDHHLNVDGIVGPQVWRALEVALRQNQVTTSPYIFVTVDEQATETLRVWANGKVILSSPTNTGISQSPTSIGTWPIYLRYQTQEMTGTTPWGTTYDDPSVPYVNYFHGGDAVHGFPRASYGTPQSMGCVELPVTTAKSVYTLVNYGTLVSVRPE